MTLNRCKWVSDRPLYLKYHDEEWGVPVHDDQLLFEFLTLETFQAGLSWLTVLRKRENFRRAFDGFDVAKVALFDEMRIAELICDASIIRNRLKIRAAISNASAFLKVQEEFGSFDAYIWRFTDGRTVQNNFTSEEDLPASTGVSDIISKDLKKRGFKFVGPTVIYAHMQATGMVNDHTTDCFRHSHLS